MMPIHMPGFEEIRALPAIGVCIPLTMSGQRLPLHIGKRFGGSHKKMDAGCRINPAVFVKPRRISRLPYPIRKMLIGKSLRFLKLLPAVAACYFKDLSFTAPAGIIGCGAPFCICRDE